MSTSTSAKSDPPSHGQVAAYTPPDYVVGAGRLSVYELFEEAASRYPQNRSLVDDVSSFCYAETLARVNAIAAGLAASGIRQGDRVAILAHNCIVYIELHLAAAKLGAIVACQNWRLPPQECRQCIDLVAPSLLLYSSRFSDAAVDIAQQSALEALCLESVVADWTSTTSVPTSPVAQDPELGLLILYTSGTTGPAKAALISQRALIARMMLLQTDLKIDRGDGFVAWSPMFHMGGSEHSISTLMMGGTVFVVDGFDPQRIAALIAEEQLGWLLLVPATIDRLLEALDAQGVVARGIRCVGAMADLLPKKQLAAITARLQAPFLNTFGATETGIAPASAHLIPTGIEPASLAKRLNFLCAVRLLDEAGCEVAPGEVGEAAVRGPTLFSGYWGNEAANRKDFVDGWFRMGDLFSRNGDGTYDFRGRSKYLIKSGGENIYPAEIEAILLADHRVGEAVVLASRDEKWGEVPVAVIASEVEDTTTLSDTLLAACRAQLAGYKCPRKILFLPLERFTRNTSGKIDRNLLAEQLVSEGAME